MSDEEISRLLRQAPFSFVGTVEHRGAATMTDVLIDDRTAVVRVDHVLHAPDAFLTLQGHRITVQLLADREPPAVGESMAFFAEGLALGDSVAVVEVGRHAVDSGEPRVTRALEAGDPGAFASLQRDIEVDRLREHADGADAIVVGRVVRLEKAAATDYSEHDPDWWQATLEVQHVERGTVEPGPMSVLYANSLDVQWRAAPHQQPREVSRGRPGRMAAANGLSSTARK